MMSLKVIFIIFISVSLATEESNGCNPGDESCSSSIGRASLACHEYLLPWLCRINHPCCRQRDPIQTPTNVEKRICGETSKKCQKMGGTCYDSISAKKSCKTMIFSKLCSSPSCACCIGDHTVCNALPRCRLRGGYCYKGKKKNMCPSRNTQRSGCEGKKCSCCFPDRGCTCGRALPADRVVGGQKLNPPNKYPWMVGIQAPGELNGTYLCGGAIINRYYVVTAAHCLFNPFGIKRGPDDLKIGVADHNQFSTKDDIKGATAKVSVRRVIIHEDFYNAGAGNDIALLKLEMPLDLASYPQLKAVCLPRKPRTTYENATGTVYGWGTTEKNYFPQAVLRETSIPILNPECENKIIGGVKIKPEMLCAGLKNGGKDSCAGDSGGPLTVEENRRHTLVGITSFGVGCGLPDTPGVYTRMTAYLDWIMDKTKDSTYCN